MAREVEPKLSEHPGSKMWWEKLGLEVEGAKPAPTPPPPVSPEVGESLLSVFGAHYPSSTKNYN